jgi:hypothetical protein
MIPVSIRALGLLVALPMCCPQIQFGPGLREVPDYRKVSIEPPSPQVPDGFTPTFNGCDLAGWHVSTEARHGVRPDIEASSCLWRRSPTGDATAGFSSARPRRASRIRSRWITSPAAAWAG